MNGYKFKEEFLSLQRKSNFYRAISILFPSLSLIFIILYPIFFGSMSHSLTMVVIFLPFVVGLLFQFVMVEKKVDMLASALIEMSEKHEDE